MLPHYTFAAVLAWFVAPPLRLRRFADPPLILSGLYGIRNKLPLTLPPLSTAYATGPAAKPPPALERLPKTLQDAAAKMGAADSLARKVLGDAFVDHFVATRVSLLCLAGWGTVTDSCLASRRTSGTCSRRRSRVGK